MSKILFVCNFFNNPNKVSSQRTTHLVDSLRERSLDVDVLCSGEKDSFNTSVMTLNESATSNTLSFLKNFFRYRSKLARLAKNYDLIVLSVPRFSLLYFFSFSLGKEKKILLDLRDQLQLQELNRESRGVLLTPLIKFLNFIDRKLFSMSIKNVNSIVCVGEYSKSHLISNFKEQTLGLPIYNVHNGFLAKDLLSIKNNTKTFNEGSYQLTAALVGNISYFRDSHALRNDLTRISEELVKTNKVLRIMHWGKVTKSLEMFISNLKNIEYKPQGFVERQQLLKKITLCSFSILVTSTKLKWEPTTTVFDYILTDNPILMIGGRANEAKRIIDDVGHRSFFSEDFIQILKVSPISVNSNMIKYSREYNAEKFYEAVVKTIS